MSLYALWERWGRAAHSHPWNNTLLSGCRACNRIILKEVRLWH